MEECDLSRWATELQQIAGAGGVPTDLCGGTRIWRRLLCCGGVSTAASAGAGHAADVEVVDPADELIISDPLLGHAGAPAVLGPCHRTSVEMRRGCGQL